jgi:hypothetical protein
MKNFWKKHRIVLVISAFLLIILPLFCWAALTMVAKVRVKADLIQEKMIDNNLEKTKIEKIPKMEEVNAEFEKNKDATGIILNANNKVDFIEYIESLAAETKNDVGIKVLNDNQNNAVVKETKAKTVKKDDAGEVKKSIEERLLYKQYISMQVDLVGDYAGFLNFVHKLENNKYYVNIVSFNLQKELINKADLSKKQNSSSNGIFLSPPGQSDVSAVTENDGELMLKSSLSIIVYIE